MDIKADGTTSLDGMEESKSKVAGHLESPKKKKRDYAVLVFSDSFDIEVAHSIENFIRSNFKFLTIVKPKSKRELGIMASKNVYMVVMDDKFLWKEECFQELIKIKSRRSSTIPILFLTDDEHRLVTEYGQNMAAFQEVDNYILYRKYSTDQILARVQKCVKFKNRRASKRYKVSIPVRYYALHDDKMYEGKIVDISIHGAVLKDVKGRIFRGNEQIRVSLPVNKLVKYDLGEFFKISAKVRRVMIDGSSCGVSWEHLSIDHTKILTSYVIAIVQKELEASHYKSRMRSRLSNEAL